MGGELQVILIGAFSTVLTGVIAWLGTKISAWLEEKTKSSKLSRYMEVWKRAAINAVSRVAQTYADQVRDENGWLTEEQKKEALETAKAIIKSEMSAGAYLVIEDFVTDMDSWIESLIENAVREDNKAMTALKAEVQSKYGIN